MRMRFHFEAETGWARDARRRRGPTKQAMDQGNLLNAQAAQSGQESNQLFGMAAPAVQKMISSPGYDPATQSAIVNDTVGGATEPFAGAQDTAARTAAASNNSAGLDTTLDNLAREKSAAASNAANDAQIEIANDKQQQEQQGIADAGSLFGTAQGTMRGLYGSATPLFGQQQKSNLPGILGGAAGAVGGLFG